MALNLGTIKYLLGVDTSGLNKAGNHVKRFQGTSNKAFNSVNNTANKLRNTLTLLISVETIRRTAMLADKYGLLQDRIKAVVGDTEKAASVFKRLQDISGKTGAALEVTAGGFQKLLFAKETVRGTDEEMIKLTESFVQLGMISGTSTEALSGAMLQFSQGLISGTFQAQEFQSVLENVPAIAGEIAEGMGITVQELIAMKKEGKLLSEEVFRALVNRADEINEKAAEMPMRLSRGFARFSLGIQQALGQLDEANGLTQKLGENFFKAGEKLQTIPQGLEAAVKVLNDIAEENKNIVALVKTFALLQATLMVVNASMAITAGLISFIATKRNVFIALASGVVVFQDEILAASKAAQGLLEALVHIFDFDFTAAKESLMGISETYKETLEDMASQDLEEGEGTASFLSNFLESFDIGNLDVVRDFYTELNLIQETALQKQLELDKKAIKDSGNQAKEKAFLLVKWEKWTADTKKSIKMNASQKETELAGQSFNQQISLAAEHSKEFAALAKAIALFDLVVKTPQAIGDAFTWGNSIGGPPLGAVTAGIAGAAMGVQIAAVSSASFTPRAIGGDVFPNQLYKVNENGPELFNFGGQDILATGNSRGSITPNGDFGTSSGAMSQPVTVNIFPIEGETATVQESEDENGLVLDVIMERVDEAVAEGISRGTSNTSRSLTEVFGLNRAAGAI